MRKYLVGNAGSSTFASAFGNEAVGQRSDGRRATHEALPNNAEKFLEKNFEKVWRFGKRLYLCTRKRKQRGWPMGRLTEERSLKIFDRDSSNAREKADTTLGITINSN